MGSSKFSSKFEVYNKFQIDKIGNAIIYLSNNIPFLSKTKALKLIYILDELSIIKYGIPFFNLNYKVWKFGPVAEDLYIELSDEPGILKDYITKIDDGTGYIKSSKNFSDNEFTRNDLKLIDYVIQNFGSKSSKELISYTHRPNAPWHNTASKNDVLDLLIQEKVNTTEFVIDMSELVAHDKTKYSIYLEYIELH
jgi:uncharacterized phage-associated protein